MSSELLLLTSEEDCEAVLPSLALLPHRVRTLPADPGALLSGGAHDVIVVDARNDLAGARDLCRLLAAGDVPVVALVNEGGLVTISAEWGVDDILLPTTGPAEIDARLRLLVSRRNSSGTSGDGSLRVGDLVIEEATYTARLKGRALELTYKEFELLKYLAQHAGRVFTRAQLLQEVWGYDFFGGTRTVDVHVRRLRAKLGPEHDSMIGTVRNVGYKFVRPNRHGGRVAAEQAELEGAEFEAAEYETADAY
ncbi:response regulator transcription factor [Saccharopolyspora sp. ASAGF58]|uniref:winged helix-turn-helix transcriptional regulator n=1 Tax=Saccharopolyspora TaxID=1835 RepID=UPI00143FC1CA|nr:response regulator transcription factor [Saccharopolyspora sp. ASAGF58]QIZ35044.1 response regulator transcription factor [Saccharopolyspora sp. ASAGF58]